MIPVSVNYLHQIPTSKWVVLAPEGISAEGDGVTPSVRRFPWRMLRLQREAIGALVGLLFSEERQTLKVVSNYVAGFKLEKGSTEQSKGDWECRVE